MEEVLMVEKNIFFCIMMENTKLNTAIEIPLLLLASPNPRNLGSKGFERWLCRFLKEFNDLQVQKAGLT
jgi:hypothetical protein